MSLRFGIYALAIGVMTVTLGAASVFRAVGSQGDEASAAISATGELLQFSRGSLSLPPSNGPGATPTGTITAKLTALPPAGRPKLPRALEYLAFSSDATIDITGSLIVTLKPVDGPCTGVRTGVAFLGGSGWDSWQRHFAQAEFGCDSAGNFIATLAPMGRLRLAPGSPIVLAIAPGHALPL
jgi:hypothetical protein